MSARQSGYTLIELVMVIVVLGTMGAVIAGPFVGAVDMVKNMSGWSDLGEDSRRIGNLVVSEIRMNNGHSSWRQWSATDLGFTTVRGDSVRFTWSGTGAPLLARYNTVTDTVCGIVDSMAFSFKNTVGGAASDLDVLTEIYYQTLIKLLA